VVTDEHGTSRGFGFVHFDSEASAQGCIQDVNGKIIGGQEVGRPVRGCMPRARLFAFYVRRSTGLVRQTSFTEGAATDLTD